ncbi:MAG: thiamine pyrophosphate-dependent dehydrogenase E1 component subunit alpha, partial [Alphaproteobacteria bacterium]|nr:thiamine pyrophosphate-dependent dehydrogenase E1 component subunit alpha [Alphaproteobacteria bacterium]
NGSGPQLIQAMTYRLRGHFAHDDAGYRDPAEVEEALKHEPIGRIESWLLDNGFSREEIDAMRNEVTDEIAGYVEDAKNAPWPDP